MCNKMGQHPKIISNIQKKVLWVKPRHLRYIHFTWSNQEDIFWIYQIGPLETWEIHRPLKADCLYRYRELLQLFSLQLRAKKKCNSLALQWMNFLDSKEFGWYNTDLCWPFWCSMGPPISMIVIRRMKNVKTPCVLTELLPNQIS